MFLLQITTLNMGGVKIKCHKCLNMKYGHHPRQISSRPLTALLMVIFTLRKSKLNGKILLPVFLFMSGASTVHSVSAR